MKIRYAFVSNSSATSFILKFDTMPETEEKFKAMCNRSSISDEDFDEATNVIYDYIVSNEYSLKTLVSDLEKYLKGEQVYTIYGGRFLEQVLSRQEFQNTVSEENILEALHNKFGDLSKIAVCTCSCGEDLDNIELDVLKNVTQFKVLCINTD